MPSTARDDLEVATDVRQLTNERLFREAATLGMERIDSAPFGSSRVELVYETVRAHSLGAIFCRLDWGLLPHFDGYEPALVSDLFRRDALLLLRQGKLRHARSYVRMAGEHAREDPDDHNRHIVVEALYGLLDARNGLQAEALKYYRASLEAWSHVDEPNVRWVLDCEYWQLASMAAVGVMPGRWRQTLRYIKREPQIGKRLGALAYALFGGLAVARPMQVGRRIAMTTKWE